MPFQPMSRRSRFVPNNWLLPSRQLNRTSNHDRELPQHDDAGTALGQGEVILIPWIKPPMRKFRDVIQPASASTQRTRPIRAERRAGLIRAIARGRQWLDEIVSGRFTIEEIAVRQKCSVRQINLTLSMAFLAPPLVKAAIEGRLPRGIGIAELRDAPPEWSKQYTEAWIANALVMFVGTTAVHTNVAWDWSVSLDRPFDVAVCAPRRSCDRRRDQTIARCRRA